MKLTERSLAHMVAAKTFTENQGRINSIDYSADGMHMITSSDDDSIILYNCSTGSKTRSVNSKKYGVDLIHFAHNISNAIHCSTKVDDTIRYLSLHDNKYIRYFPGHTKKVMTLCMSPLDDMFLSGSADKTIRLWDLRSQACQGLMQVSSKAVAAFDPEGLIFAAGINSEHLKLYDLRSFDKGPFNSFPIPRETECDWTGMKFSPDGKSILLTTNGKHMHVVDAFTGQVRFTLRDHQNAKSDPLEGTFTPDSNFVFCGSSDGRIFVWSLDSGSVVSSIASSHPGPVQRCSFNPKYFMLATACSQLNLWIPDDDAE